MTKFLIILVFVTLTIGCSRNGGSQWESGWVKLNSGEVIQCNQIVHWADYINCDGRKFPSASVAEYEDGRNFYGEP